MDNKIQELIKLAKIKLFTKQILLFGMLLHKFGWSVVDVEDHIEGFVVFNKEDLSTLETGKIYLNQKYLSLPDYTFNNLTYLLCHELLHILNKHGLRREDRIHHVWSVAADHVIEVFLKRLSNIIQPYKHKYNIIPDLEREKPNCTAEQAYDWLIKNNNLSISKDSKTNMIKVTNKNNNQTIVEFFDDLESQSADQQESQSSSKIIHQINQFIAESRAIFETLKQKGDLPGYIVSYLNEILKVQIPWEKLIEKAIKTNVIVKPDDRSWRQLNKMYIPHSIFFPGYSYSEEKENVGILVILVDSSGSISDKNLKKFSGVIESSMKYFKEIHLYIHDVNIHQQKIFSQDNISQFYNFIKQEGYKGRQGTSHKDVFTKIEEEYWNKNKDDLSMIISLTDMYSDIQYEYKKYNWIKNNIPLVFVITSDGQYLEFDSSYSNITQIKID